MSDQDEVFQLRRDVLDRQTKAIDSGDVAGILASYTDDVVWEDAFLGQTWHGKEELSAIWTDWLAVMVQRADYCELKFISGKYGATDYLVGGELYESRPEVAASMIFKDAKNRSFSGIRGTSLIEFAEDGRIRRGTDYWDLAGLRRQLGMPL
jgi:ketosteroid isomerase-like protein